MQEKIIVLVGSMILLFFSIRFLFKKRKKHNLFLFVPVAYYLFLIFGLIRGIIIVDYAWLKISASFILVVLAVMSDLAYSRLNFYRSVLVLFSLFMILQAYIFQQEVRMKYRLDKIKDRVQNKTSVFQNDLK